MPRQRSAARGRRRRQHGDVEPDHRRRVGRVRPGAGPAGAGRGDDEQRDPRDERVDVLRDGRRRSGRVRDGGRPVGGARRDVERPQHARRGARARVPAARRAVRAAAQVRWRRGARRGGDGVVREIRALEPCRLSVLGDRRRHAPAGAMGGEPGRRVPPSSAARRCRASRASCEPATSFAPRRRAAAATETRRLRVGSTHAGTSRRSTTSSLRHERGGPRGSTPVRAQGERLDEAVEGERGRVPARGRRDRPHHGASARGSRHGCATAGPRGRGREGAGACREAVRRGGRATPSRATRSCPRGSAGTAGRSARRRRARSSRPA